MGQIKTAHVVPPVAALESPEDWQYFTYTCDKSCVTLLTCPLQKRLIPQGEHLTKRCRNWQKRGYYKSDGVPNVLKTLYLNQGVGRMTGD